MYYLNPANNHNVAYLQALEDNMLMFVYTNALLYHCTFNIRIQHYQLGWISKMGKGCEMDKTVKMAKMYKILKMNKMQKNLVVDKTAGWVKWKNCVN